MVSNSGRALVADSDASVRQSLRTHLELDGYVVDEAADGRDGLLRLRTIPYELVIADTALPSVDGTTLCRAARAAGPNANAAILLTSAGGSEADAVVALAGGADDHVAKPFGVGELLARADAIIRRHRRPLPVTTAGVEGEIALDVARRQAIVRGRPVELTRQEFDVLHQLVACPGTVLSRATLMKQASRGGSRAGERAIDVAISRLRRKIESDPHHPRLILTAWGVGYKLGVR